MSIKDALKFEKFNLGKMWDDLKADPKRIFLGVDPLSTKGWNAILGRDDESIVGHLGAPKKENFAAAEAKGIDTGTAQNLHKAAQTVAAAWGAYGAGGALSSAAGAGASGGTTGAIAPVTTSVAPVGTGVGGAALGGGVTAALPEVVVSGAAGGFGGGAIAAGAGAGAGAVTANGSSGNSTSKNSWSDKLQRVGGNLQQQGQNQQSEEERILEALARQGPPPAQQGANVGPVPVDQYRAALTPSGIGAAAVG